MFLGHFVLGTFANSDRKKILRRFGIAVATRFQEDPVRNDSCINFWTCTGFGTSSTFLRGSCSFPQVFEPSKEKCLFYTDATTKCYQYYAGKMTTDEKFELKKTYLSRSKWGTDIKSNLSWFDRQTAIKDYINDLWNRLF